MISFVEISLIFTTQLWAKIPSQELSDTLVEAFQDKLKKDE